MGAVVQFKQYRQQSEVESLRQAGYRAIDEMVEKLKDQIEGKGLEELSKTIRCEGQSVTGAILEEAIKIRGAKQLSATTYVCQECGRTLHRHPKLHERTLETLHGEVKIERPYFYCKHCDKGYHPFDEELELSPKRKQYDLQRAAAELFTEVPYKRASQIFERLTGIRMSDHCLQDVADGIGQAADNVRVLPSRQQAEKLIEEESEGRVWRPVLVVAGDGAHVPTRKPARSRRQKRGPGEWREAKGFRIYLVGQDRITQIMSWHQIANEEEFGEALKYAATMIPVEKVRVALLGDGSKWIWNHLKAVFPEGKEILDYYHCSEYVHKVAKIWCQDIFDKLASRLSLVLGDNATHRERSSCKR